jgi:hypothetical protein
MMITTGRASDKMFLQCPTGPDGWTAEWLPIVKEERKWVTEFFLLGRRHSEFENRRLLPIGEQVLRIAVCQYCSQSIQQKFPTEVSI